MREKLHGELRGERHNMRNVWGENISACRVLVRKPEEMRPICRLRHYWIVKK